MEIALAEKDHRRALAVARATRARAGADLTLLTSHASERPSAREARASAVAELTKAREALLTEAEHDWELPADAAARAREARAEKALRTTALYEEHLRSLDAAATPLEVPALAPGEVELVIHPTLDGWVALAVTAQAVRVSRLDRLSAEASGAELARSLVEPFDAELSSAKRVRVLASGAMRAVDVHALPWRGRPGVRIRGHDAERSRDRARHGLEIGDARSGQAHRARSVVRLRCPRCDLVRVRAERLRVRDHGGREIGAHRHERCVVEAGLVALGEVLPTRQSHEGTGAARNRGAAPRGAWHDDADRHLAAPAASLPRVEGQVRERRNVRNDWPHGRDAQSELALRGLRVLGRALCGVRARPLCRASSERPRCPGSFDESSCALPRKKVRTCGPS